jgi:hypothetical protein
MPGAPPALPGPDAGFGAFFFFPPNTLFPRTMEKSSLSSLLLK